MGIHIAPIYKAKTIFTLWQGFQHLRFLPSLWMELVTLCEIGNELSRLLVRSLSDFSSILEEMAFSKKSLDAIFLPTDCLTMILQFTRWNGRAGGLFQADRVGGRHARFGWLSSRTMPTLLPVCCLYRCVTCNVRGSVSASSIKYKLTSSWICTT